MKLSYYFSLCLCILLFASCSDKDDDLKTEPEEPESGFSFDITEDIILTSEEGARAFVPFSSELDWQAEVSADWLAIAPAAGEPGRNVILITALTANDADESREAVLTLTSGDASETITVRQETSDYIRLEQDVYQVDAEGGILEIIFSTSMNTDELRILCDASWLNQDNLSRAMTDYSIVLNVEPNPDTEARYARIMFVKEDGVEQKILATVIVVQSNESTDYSADGEVTVLQNATKGSGIPIVLMGDGFIDAEIADGTYLEVMQKACENLFTEEPVKSLRDYFNVYSVAAVSASNAFGYGETAIGCELEGGNSTGISGDEIAVQKYVRYVDREYDIDTDNTLAVVILNTDSYAGTTYFGFTSMTSLEYTEFAIAYCPIIYNLESDEFRQVLTHEAIGHGFAKLEDEYSYEEMGVMPESAKEVVRQFQALGWAQNVDFTDNPDEVLWSAFLTDERYAAEDLGIYEGACTYMSGVYRPSKNSMMNDNTVGFNAPSRRAIYDRVMEDGMGKTPTYEEFVTFDQSVNTLQIRNSRSSTVKSGRPFARPRFMDKSLAAD